jgi:hypothetical protein
MRIGASHPRLWATNDIGVKMNNLIERVDARIRPTRANCTDCAADKGTESAFQRILNRLSMRLLLPTLP